MASSSPPPVPDGQAPAVPGDVVTVVVVPEGPGGCRSLLDDTLVAVQEQIRAPDRTVVVHVGRSPGGTAVASDRGLSVPAGSSFATAVAAGLACLDSPYPDQPDPECASPGFVWLLRQDSVPAPDALERLLAYASVDQSVAVLGPKVLDLADPLIIVEVGIGMDGAGRWVTGINRGECDLGQHDAIRDVLAVSAPGALIRGHAWARLGGFDPDLHTAFDLDFCWRAWRAGMRVAVVPAATIRLAPGADRPAMRDGLRVRLANVGRGRIAAAWLWLSVAGLLRGAGLMASGRFRRGWLEMAATVEVIGRPGWVWRARRSRAATVQVPARALRPLFPGRGELRRTSWARRASWRIRRIASPAESRSHPFWPVGLLLTVGLAIVTVAAARFLRNPGWGPVGVAVTIPGGVLPLGGGARDLWSAVLAGGSPTGDPSTGAQAAALLPLAVLATVLGGKPWLAADVVLLAGPALAGLSAFAAAARVTRQVTNGRGADPRILAIFAAAYALGPPAAWAVVVGRVDVVLALMVVPGAVAAAFTLLAGTGRGGDGWRGDGWRDDGWPAAGRLTVWLVLAFACAPGLVVIAAAGLVGAVAALRRPDRLLPVLLPLLVAALPLGLWHEVVLGDVRALFGTARAVPVDAEVGPAIGWHDAGSRPAVGQVVPVGVVLLVPVAALAAIGLVRAGTRRPAIAAWAVVVLGLAGAALQAHADGGAGAAEPAGAPLGVAVAGLAIAASFGASGARTALRRRSIGWRQIMAVPLGGALVLGPPAAGLAFVAGGGMATGAAARAGGTEASWQTVGRLSGPDARLLVLRQPSLDPVVLYALMDAAGRPAGGLSGGAPPGRLVETIVGDLTIGRARGAPGPAALRVTAVVVPFPDAQPPLVAVLDAAPDLVRHQMVGDALVWRVITPDQNIAPGTGRGAGPIGSRG